MSDLSELLGAVYEAMEGSDTSLAYSERHGIASQAILTVTDDEIADLIAEHLRPHIEGKIVVEIGGGLGLLSLHMGHIAKRVYCIEANPMWSWMFAQCLLAAKPKNVSFLFGAADEFVGSIKGDIAIVCSHSGLQPMKLAASQFAPVVIDFYGKLIAEAPHLFDPFAREARNFA